MKLDRRTFLKWLGVGSAATVAAPKLLVDDEKAIDEAVEVAGLEDEVNVLPVKGSDEFAFHTGNEIRIGKVEGEVVEVATMNRAEERVTTDGFIEYAPVDLARPELEVSVIVLHQHVNHLYEMVRRRSSVPCTVRFHGDSVTWNFAASVVGVDVRSDAGGLACVDVHLVPDGLITMA